MYHIVYETYKKENPNHNYIGIHSTNDLDDGYLGSGDKLMEGVKKRGKHSYDRRTLVLCETRDIAFDIEDKLVSSMKPYYNIFGGGRGNGVGESHPCYGKSINKGNKRPDLSERNRTSFNFGKKRPRQSQIMKDKSCFLDMDFSGSKNGRYIDGLDVDSIIKMIDDGNSVNKVSKIYGVSNGTINRRLKK